jgi:hypothetical protein
MMGPTHHHRTPLHTEARSSFKTTRQLNKDAPNGTGVKALRPLTRSGYARALTPTPYLGAPSNCVADQDSSASAP